MIRFECDQCARPLRAPEGLAGKKGRCARCGAINTVPMSSGRGMRVESAEPALPVSVEVKRAASTSPFRDTADMTVQSAGAHFIGAGAATVAMGESAMSAGGAIEVSRPRDFVDRLAEQIGELAEPLTADGPRRDSSMGDSSMGDASMEGGLPALEACSSRGGAGEAALEPLRMRRRWSMSGAQRMELPGMSAGAVEPLEGDLKVALVRMLVVGVALGFVLGVAAAKWLF